MGADIHMYVEYRNKRQAKDLETQGRDPYWHSFGERFNPGRNYTMFAVRSEEPHLNSSHSSVSRMPSSA